MSVAVKTFADCLPVILREEGGFSDDARDPGGVTNLGVTAATWAAWTGQPATEAIMRALTPERVTPLYRADYWNAVDGDKLPDGLNLCVFDFAVNGGPGRAAKTLQGVVGAAQDGQVGPGTLGAIDTFVGAHGLKELVQAYCDSRAAFYRSLPTFATFGKGWLNRVDYVEGIALSWVG